MEEQEKNGLNNVQGEIVSNDELKNESVVPTNPQTIINEQLKVKVKTLEKQIKELERERQDYLDEKRNGLNGGKKRTMNAKPSLTRMLI